MPHFWKNKKYKFSKKRSVELALKTVIIAVLLLIVMFFSIYIFIDKYNKGSKNLEVNNSIDINKEIKDIIKDYQ